MSRHLFVPDAYLTFLGEPDGGLIARPSYADDETVVIELDGDSSYITSDYARLLATHLVQLADEIDSRQPTEAP